MDTEINLRDSSYSCSLLVDVLELSDGDAISVSQCKTNAEAIKDSRSSRWVCTGKLFGFDLRNENTPTEWRF